MRTNEQCRREEGDLLLPTLTLMTHYIRLTLGEGTFNYRNRGLVPQTSHTLSKPPETYILRRGGRPGFFYLLAEAAGSLNSSKKCQNFISFFSFSLLHMQRESRAPLPVIRPPKSNERRPLPLGSCLILSSISHKTHSLLLPSSDDSPLL